MRSQKHSCRSRTSPLRLDRRINSTPETDLLRMTTVSTSAHWPQNDQLCGRVEQKLSIKQRVNQPSTYRSVLVAPCNRESRISPTACAEFSYTKVLNVVARSSAHASGNTSTRWTYPATDRERIFSKNCVCDGAFFELLVPPKNWGKRY